MIEYREEELTLLEAQGHCNLNYLLQKEHKRFLLRKFRLLGRDRKKECRIQNIAAKRGIAPLVYHCDGAIMMMEFIEGKHLKKLTKKQTRALALTLSKLHKIPFRAKRENLLKEVKNRAIHLAIQRYPREFTLTHNDLNTKNILFGKKVTLLDWEYAGLGDRYFDLATVCEEFVLDEAYFLRAYGGRISAKKLSLYKKIYAILDRQWFLKLQKGQHLFAKEAL